jgi:hypothetical protein
MPGTASPTGWGITGTSRCPHNPEPPASTRRGVPAYLARTRPGSRKPSMARHRARCPAGSAAGASWARRCSCPACPALACSRSMAECGGTGVPSGPSQYLSRCRSQPAGCRTGSPWMCPLPSGARSIACSTSAGVHPAARNTRRMDRSSLAGMRRSTMCPARSRSHAASWPARVFNAGFPVFRAVSPFPRTAVTAVSRAPAMGLMFGSTGGVPLPARPAAATGSETGTAHSRARFPPGQTAFCHAGRHLGVEPGSVTRHPAIRSSQRSHRWTVRSASLVAAMIRATPGRDRSVSQSASPAIFPAMASRLRMASERSPIALASRETRDTGTAGSYRGRRGASPGGRVRGQGTLTCAGGRVAGGSSPG